MALATRGAREAAHLETVGCPVCSATGDFIFQQRDLLCSLPGEFGVRFCAKCGMYFLSPRVPEGEIHRYYQATYGPYQAGRLSPFVKWAAERVGLVGRRNRIVERYVAGGRILDVGCGNGEFLAHCDPQRWERFAMDIEANGKFEFAGEFFAGCFDCEPAPAVRELDAITLWHVFEHLYHPEIALKNAAEILKKDGYLFLAVPEPDCPERRLFGRSWIGWDVPRHIATYTRVGMEKYVSRAGLHLVDVVADACNGHMSMLNLEFLLRSRGSGSSITTSAFCQALAYPWVLASEWMGLEQAKVYVIQK